MLLALVCRCIFQTPSLEVISSCVMMCWDGCRRVRSIFCLVVCEMAHLQGTKSVLIVASAYFGATKSTLMELSGDMVMLAPGYVSGMFKVCWSMLVARHGVLEQRSVI